MRQSNRNRPPVASDQQRRVASSDTRQMMLQNSQANNVYEQAFDQHQNNSRKANRAASQNRPQKEINRSNGFRQSSRQNQQQNSSAFLNAADLLNVGHSQEEDENAMPTRPGPYGGTGHKKQQNSAQPPQNRGQQRLSQAGQAYQSSLLTRYVKQPNMPSSQSIHSALNYERSNGWPSLGPVREAAAAHVQARNGAASSGIPRPSANKFKSKTGRMPSQGPQGQRSGNKVKYAFQTPITYQNEQEIMKKIFGANAMVKRTNSDSRFTQQYNPLNNTGYSHPGIHPYDLEGGNSAQQKRRASPNKKKTPQAYSSKMPPKAQSRQQRQGGTNQAQYINDPNGRRATYSNAAQVYEDALITTSPKRRPTDDSMQVQDFSEPRTSDARYKKKNMLHQEEMGKSPQKANKAGEKENKKDVAEDQAERAFFELQDAKVNFFNERTEYEDKMEKRKQNQTFTNGFGAGGGNSNTNTTQDSSQAQTTLYGGNRIASRSNGFQMTNPNKTGQRWGDQPLIGDEKGLKSDVGDLSREELNERLLVAEKVMKTLFKRNKDLEELQMEQQSITDIQSNGRCKGADYDNDREATGNEQQLKQRIKELEAQLEAVAQGQKEISSEPQSYKDFMTMRLEQSQTESKRHFENYVSVRDQLNQLMEKQVLQLENKSQKSQLNTPDSRQQMVTPKSIPSGKGSKLRQDLGARAFEASLQEQELVLQREAERYAKGLQEVSLVVINLY